MQRLLGLLKQADLDPEEIADMLWLAGKMDPPIATISPIAPEDHSKQQAQQKPANREGTAPGSFDSSSSPPLRDESSAVVTLPTANTPEQPKAVKKSSDLPFKAPAAPALRNSLELSRSLRPLMRKVPSRIEMVLDEEATAIAMVESREQQWSPVLKPASERWLDLTLVVEDTQSTVIWQELIVEVQQLLERLGAFRVVRVWTLRADTYGELQLFPRRRFSAVPQGARRPKELLDPSGRQLILVLSDCVSPIWCQEKIYPWLKEWSNASLTAIFQLFPERLWDRSALGLGSLVSLKAFAPGTANSQLEVDDFPGWKKLDRLQDLILPIVPLEPVPLGQWARVMSGFGNSQTAGVVFNLGWSKTQNTTTFNVDEALPELNAEELVQRFRATASRMARRLAVLMSSVPVSLPVVHLIQEAMLPVSRQVHVAEVFMSGLLISSVSSGGGGSKQLVQYEFVDGVREILQASSSKTETLRLLDRVAEYIARRFGLPQRSFAALLKMWSEEGDFESGEISYFAKISTQVLRRMGSDYADWVDRLGQGFLWQRAEVEVVTIEFSDELKLEPYEFELATLRLAKDLLELTDVFRIIEQAMKARTREDLTALQQEIIEGTWKNQSYAEIADREALSVGYVSKVGGALFLSLSEELRQTITKRNMVQVLSKLVGKPMQAGYEVVRMPGRAEQFVEALGVDVGLEMVRIPAGEFMMGSPEDELHGGIYERPQHLVTVPEFYLGKYPVTQAQWREVAQLPLVDRELETEPSGFKGDDLPVETVSWYAAVEFCRRLSVATGRNYRLPSEAEWEYACRAGTTTPFHFGETISTDLANYDGNDIYGDGKKGIYRQTTTPVGGFNAANAFGLHDMHGNVWEWCLEHYHSGYEGVPSDGSASQGAGRRMRGGCWGSNPANCRSAARGNDNPGDQDNDIGFRVVCEAARTF